MRFERGHFQKPTGQTRLMRALAMACLALALTACGGGGGNSGSSANNVTMSVSPHSESASATTTQLAPTEYIQVNFTGLNTGQYVYIDVRSSGQGIYQVLNSNGYLPASIPVQLDSPTSLGPGTYTGKVEILGCMDQACHQPVLDSPQTVTIKYTVTKSTFAITGVSPATSYVGLPSFTLTVNGSTFTPQSAVVMDGVQLQTNFVNSSQLTAQVPAVDLETPGSKQVSVSDPVNGITSTKTFTVVPSPITITSFSPATIYAGGNGFTLTVNGSNFTSQSTILWNGTALQTSFLNSTKISAQISAAEITTSGTNSIAVSDPVYGTSETQAFTVAPAHLALNSIEPTTVTAGTPSFTLTVLGSAFTGTSVINWNGVALPTTLISSAEVIAQVPVSDVSATGTASILVSDPNSAPGTTVAATLTIATPSVDAVAYQINPAHSGAVTFSSVNFPSSATWSVDVGGTPSYAIITGGKVIVTVTISSTSSELIALDQSTGSTVWGPILLSGVANAAYDNGRVFVMSAPDCSSMTLQAFDASTGTFDWSTNLPGRMCFAGILTAADDTVYVGAEGVMNAVSESNGSLLWTQYVDGTNMPAAVTADGVYTSFYCDAHDLRPATGEIIWTSTPACTGGGGGQVPIVANQLLYAPNSFSGYSGSIFDAENGASKGSYAADTPPAFTSTMGYFLQSGTLSGVTLSNNTAQWNFTGDGTLDGAPIAVNQYVFIGTSSGNLYALDGATGTQAWNVNLGTAIDTSSATLPFSGLAAGDGLLVVPVGTKVIAYTLSP